MFLDVFVKRANNIIFEYEKPLQYLNSRGIDKEDIIKFKIGYVKIANVKKEDSQDYKALSKSTYNFKSFQNKIIFPIHNILGSVNGICTRNIEKKGYVQYFLYEAKLIGAFFGLCEALPHIHKTKRVFVHEGAIDSISFAKIFPNTISSLTSFLNEAQYEFLSFITDKIILIYDEDDAGNTGIEKMEKYYGTKVIDSIKIGEGDSNSYLQRFGFNKFESYIKSKIPKYYQ
jgi:DNA primase